MYQYYDAGGFCESLIRGGGRGAVGQIDVGPQVAEGARYIDVGVGIIPFVCLEYCSCVLPIGKQNAFMRGDLRPHRV